MPFAPKNTPKKHLPKTSPLFRPSLRSDIEFRIIGQYFVELNNLPVEFNFANYLNRLFLKYLAELGEISPLSWFTLVILVCINWFRAAYVDPDAQRPRYYFYTHPHTHPHTPHITHPITPM